MSSSHQEGQQGHHPTFKQYVLVATILFAITIVEFLLIWPRAGVVDSLGYSKIPLLAILSAIKFAIVIAFYMHLKFDHRLFTWVFLAGLFLAFGVGVALLTLFLSLGGEPRAYALERAIPYDEHAVELAKEKAKERAAEAAEATPMPTEPAPDATPAEAMADTPTQASEPASKPAGLDGQEIFLGSGGCGACHAVDGVSQGLVGPDLSHLGTEAASRKPGTSAEDYIFESIRDPQAFVATGVDRAIPGIMTAAVTAGLSDDEVNALVDFLLAQK
ncbi:MAG: hypothetical protein BZY80_06315 [SAR202 cluster bacterium Io17-Chloro-G2]|nr:MAG: hypothetical protein BZY80_06315 [SAR202 cluster bacterium Io17-Chloro-G2]